MTDLPNSLAASAAVSALPVRQQSVVFEVTQRCNHDCLHCYNVWKSPVDYPAGELNTHETLDVLGRWLDETQANNVSLSGGEPLLRPDLDVIIDWLRDRGVSVNLICNGSLLNEAAVARLAPDRISVFELPLLSADRSIHDRLSGRPGAFDRVTLAMANLTAARQHVVGVFVATRLNLPTWRATAELAVALGLNGIMFNRFNPGGRGREHIDLLQASPAELTAALDIAEQVSAEYALPIACSIALPPCLIDVSRYEHLTFGFCAAGTERAYYTLDPLGNVRPCNHSPRILGNVRDVSFVTMLGQPAMAEFVAARPVLCAGCEHEFTCQGGCKAAAEACCGSVHAADPFLAAFHAR